MDYEKKMATFPYADYTRFRFLRGEKGKVIAFLTDAVYTPRLDTPVPVSGIAEALGLKNAFYALRERL